MLIRKRAYARAGLLGNPSDGYHGKTISFIVRNFWAEVVLYEWDTVEIVLAEDDRAASRSVHDLARDVRLHGYYGGIRLVKATIKRFVEYCERAGPPLHERNFSVRYQTTIPRQVGLAGSSAIIVATLRCLMEFYEVEIPLEVQPSLVLSVERDELGIAAGLQDRVIQVYEGLVYMDFDRERERDRRRLPLLRVRAARPGAAAAGVPRLPRRAQRADRGVPQRHPRPLRPRRASGGRRRCGGSPRLAARGREALLAGDAERARRADERELRHAPQHLRAAAVADRDGRDGARAAAPAPSSPARAAPSSAPTPTGKRSRRSRGRSTQSIAAS